MAREYTQKMLSMGESETISWEDIAIACLSYMTEEQVTDMARAEFGVSLGYDPKEEFDL